MQTDPKAWVNDEQATRMTSGEICASLKQRREFKRNLLLNTGPRGDGSLHPADERSLRESATQTYKLI